MARHNEVDARPAKRLDDIEILFSGYAEDTLDALILQGGDKQVRTFHMLASWLMASERGMIHTISSNCLSARLPELAGHRRYQYQLSRPRSVAGDGHTGRQYGGYWRSPCADATAANRKTQHGRRVKSLLSRYCGDTNNLPEVACGDRPGPLGWFQERCGLQTRLPAGPTRSPKHASRAH